MPADEDYRSAAAALANSTTTSRADSPAPHPAASSPSIRSPVQRTFSPSVPDPAWARPTPTSFRRLSARGSVAASSSSSSRRNNRLNSFSSRFSQTNHQHHHHHHQSLKDRVVYTITSLTSRALDLFLSLTPLKQGLLILASVTLLILAVLALVYSHQIFTFLSPLAASWRALPGPVGPLIVWVICFCTAFPPVIGYSTSVSIAGFVYGFPWGWPIVATATVAGSTVAFYTSRGVFAKYVHRLVGQDKRFVALAQVLRRDGLGMLAMIRFCPLPYSLSNGFLATVPSIRPGTFAAATALATPKLAIHVFIGSRLALLVESGDKMSGRDRAINYVSMILFGIVGTAVGIIIYRRTMARAAELAREEGLDVEGSNDPLGDAAAAAIDGVADDYYNSDGDEDADELDFGGYADDDEVEGARLMPRAGKVGAGGGGVKKKGSVDLDVAGLMNDEDDISLWEAGGGGYRDSWDEEEAVQGNGIKR